MHRTAKAMRNGRISRHLIRRCAEDYATGGGGLADFRLPLGGRYFFRLCGAWSLLTSSPRLTPQAVFFRRFAAGSVWLAAYCSSLVTRCSRLAAFDWPLLKR